MASKNLEAPRSVPVVLVTPQMAQGWLDTRFSDERTLRKKTRVTSMARDMSAGNWYFTGDPIRFDRATGKLIDGQHRLSAIVESDTSQYMVVLDLPIEVRSVIDTGMARSLGDMLHFGGHVKGKTMAAIVRRVLTYGTGQRASEGGTYYPTMLEGVEFVEKYPEQLRNATELAHSLYAGGRRIPLSPAVVGATYFLCADKDKKQADDFFHKLIHGTGLQEGDPVLALRSRAIRTRETTGRVMSPDEAFRFILMAWNFTREGVEVKRLNTPKGGWRASNVPQVK